ncbi:DUF4390 domain-containing protein [Kingella negevensis]|uniref:DUF4390 domain-containing protein n=1 Tax=Kingella negevensis TaxID=1522312 RepID=A0A238HFR0_9NEIS|nr:DUF4390 domain-containing protein [Kingella negevensis]MDK4680510.1 DUF4390 domain-containing protein [Kingella negevensis]MDK4681767.1 DUF4390 domain-containing protein [Kingella negevensis]MDK4684974.1 DUF4390 domain-containing protein [Kingella negevensis]MDK4689220.1 DUF4390 domain-containing protein [Kingella negevensis]MDK4689964.1 DUF4390 domain-containing protein [Kingella negevensis]
MHLLKKNNRFSGCLKTLLLSVCLFALPLAHAEGIRHSRYEAHILQNGQLGISSRFITELPEQLQGALKQGVPLDFALTYRLRKPTIAAYRFKISQLANEDSVVNYRLSFHPLTNRYRVSVGTFSSEYNSLSTALKAVGAIANWQVLNQGALDDTHPSEVKVQIRLSLTTTRLPKPFQINALTSSNWDLDSGWRYLDVR